MRTRRIVILVLAIGDLIARFVLGLPGAFAVLGTVAIIGIPMCLAFMVADAVPWQRDQFIASAVAEKASAFNTEKYIGARAARASPSRFEAALAQVPDVPPTPEESLR